MPAYFEGLDRVLSGRLKPGLNLLLMGSPFSGKTTLALQFLYSGLKVGEGAILASTNETAEGMRQRMEAFGWKLDKYEDEGRIRFIDCYTRTLGIVKDLRPDTATILRLPGPYDLTGIALAISQIASDFWSDENRIRLAFDSVSSLFMYNEAPQVMRFLHILLGRLKSVEAISMLILESGVHEERIVAAVKSLCDGMIILGHDGSDRFIECVCGPMKPERAPIEITESGIRLR